MTSFYLLPFFLYLYLIKGNKESEVKADNLGRNRCTLGAFVLSSVVAWRRYGSTNRTGSARHCVDPGGSFRIPADRSYKGCFFIEKNLVKLFQL